MGRAIFGAAVVLAAGVAGCSSRYTPPFPSDVDPCASYCLIWVPPVYRDAPKVVVDKPGCYVPKTVCYETTKFREVETPGAYTEHCVPDDCRSYAIVETTPAREEWRHVSCGCAKDCYKRVRIPATYEWCEKRETDKGYSYCGYTSPEYKVVPETVCCKERVSKYAEPQYRIDYDRQVYTPGHYEWQAKYCDDPKHCDRSVCAPCDACKKPGRPCFGSCPPQD